MQCPLIRKITAGPLTKDEKVIKFYIFFSWAKTLFQGLTAVDDAYGDPSIAGASQAPNGDDGEETRSTVTASVNQQQWMESVIPA